MLEIHLSSHSLRSPRQLSRGVTDPGMSLVASRLRVLVRSLAAVLLVGTFHSAQAQFSEFQIKAERICSFARFVEWPSRKFVSPGSPFVIGVFGTDAISDFLREALQNRQIKDRQVVIKHIQTKEELSGCHVLFISRSERDRLSSVLGAVRREGVLTVGETDNFLDRGGIINLVNIGGSIRFQVNLSAAKRERLTISSKLLQLAIPENVDPSSSAAARYFSSTSIEEE